MGLFSGGQKISVSEFVYNLAGDEAKRPNYLKTSVVAAVMSSSDLSIGEQLTSNYLNGPAIKLRGYSQWARLFGYDTAIGITTSNFTVAASIDQAALAALLPAPTGQVVDLQSAAIGPADFTYWVDQYMTENHPTLLGTDYSATFNYTTLLVTVTLADTSVETFTAADFDASRQYLYVAYTTTTGQVTGSVVTGSTNTVSTLPDSTGWTLDSSTTTPRTYTLNTVTTTVNTYSDGRDSDSSSTTDSTTTSTVSDLVNTYHRTFNEGLQTDGSTLSQWRQMIQHSTSGKVTTAGTPSTTTTTIAGGVTKTSTTTTYVDSVGWTYTNQTNTQDTTQTWSDLQYLIYQQGSGNAGYDTFFATGATAGYFLPFIPIRVNNNFITSTYLPDLYPLVQKACKRAVGTKFDDLVAKIADNSSLGDIDYAYIVFGVSLNVKENACKRYIYKFFQKIMDGLAISDTAYQTWLADWTAANAAVQTWLTWFAAQSDSTNPLFGTAEPPKVSYPTAPQYTLNISSQNLSVLDYNYSIKWSGIAETTGTGLKKPDATKGEVWWETIDNSTIPSDVWGSSSGPVHTDTSTSHLRLNWQVDENSWQSLDLYDLWYQNFIYKGNAVNRSGPDALTQTIESEFLIPLNDEIYRSLSIVDSTQMCTACCFLVFNAYKVVDTPWYASGFFQVLIVIAAIAIGIATAGVGDIGLLGGSLALGTTLGFTGTTALIVGATANALAAVVLLQVIQSGATTLFGSSLGPIIGAIAGILALDVGAALMSGISAAQAFQSLMRVDNLLKLTDALGKGITNYTIDQVQGIVKETNQLVSDYNDKSKTIASQYDDVIGYDHGLIDPLTLVDVKPPTVKVPSELPSAFLDRTLLVGSDIANLSSSMITNFSDIMLAPDLLTT